jgi:hypothetical protein
MLSKTTVTRPGRPAGPRRVPVLPALAIAVLSGLALSGLDPVDAAAARPTAVGAFSALRGHSVDPTIPPGAQSLVPLPAGRIGRSYRRSLGGQGGTPPYRFALESGTLPAGLTLSEDGVVSGTPTGSGDWSFTARVLDSGGQAVTQFYHLRITGPVPLRR